jgi:glutamate dehydrogenase/leucine dehydrogenase
VLELRDEATGLDAVVVVDHDLFPVSAGGTRIASDVSVGEVARLARAMTLKFAALRVPYAGAKAGIRWNGEGDRDAIVAAYRRALEPYAEVFLTGPDLGTEPADFLDDPGDDLPFWAQSHEGLGMDDLATGHGVKAAAEAGLAHLGRSLDGATVAIEGFGKVGAGTARACARGGARVVGVSTVDGLVADPAGLDVEDLITLRAEHGDRLVSHAGVAARPREELFELECDVLVPGARPDSVSRAVAERLRCSVVAPGANVPYEEAAFAVLHERGILGLPDFVANSGGVHLYESVEGLEPAAALARIEELVGAATTRILEQADVARTIPMQAALDDARSWLEAQFPDRTDLVAELATAA